MLTYWLWLMLGTQPHACQLDFQHMRYNSLIEVTGLCRRDDILPCILLMSRSLLLQSYGWSLCVVESSTVVLIYQATGIWTNRYIIIKISYLIRSCREYTSHPGYWITLTFSHLLATHWLCTVIILIMVQITVEHNPRIWQQSILMSHYNSKFWQHYIYCYLFSTVTSLWWLYKT